MSLQSNIAKKIFSLVQKNVSKSEKKLIKLTHVFSKITIPPFIKRKISISIERVDGFDYVVMKHKTHNTNNKVMYIHGGAFIFQISTLHFLQIAEIINKTYTTFYIPIYPLTTDTYSSQFNTLDFLLKLYEIICNESDKKTSISIMGDSAGGNFALICAQLIKKNKLRICDNIVLLSPFLSYVYDKKYEEILNKDPVLTPMLLNTVKKWQLQKNDPKNPLFSPVFGDSKGIGKIYIFCAENEIFIHQIREYCNRLLKQKIWYNLDVAKDLFHDYPVFTTLKESIVINNKISDIIKKNK